MATSTSPFSLRVFVVTFLSWTLIIVTCGPFTRATKASFSRSKVFRQAQQQQVPYRDGELIVKFRAGVSPQVRDTIIATHGATRKKRLQGESALERLELPAARDVRDVALQMLLNPMVELAEPNFLIAKDDLDPNDERFNEQWALRNMGQNGGQFGSDIDAVAAWSITTGTMSTVIAVIDSGIDFTHPDLANNRWTNPLPAAKQDLHGWDFVADSAEITDEHGHGTAVAGIIAAEGNNSIGMTGVMWRAGLMSLRVLDNTGTGDVANAVEAIDYAVTHGAQVINLSWGTNAESLVLKEAIERALKRNVVVICSAGNAGRSLDSSPYYPASFAVTNLISVAATDNLDQLASWSNWGTRTVTVAAPGTNILTTQRGGGYWTVSGTSASTPVVTGIAGLLKTLRAGASPRLVAKAISESARQVASLSGKVSSNGVVSAAEALVKVKGSPNEAPILPPRGQGIGGTGPGGSFATTPPAPITQPPLANLPNLDEARNAKPQQPKAKAPIEANLPCADCDPYGGGGGAGNYPSGDPNFSTARQRPRMKLDKRVSISVRRTLTGT